MQPLVPAGHNHPALGQSGGCWDLQGQPSRVCVKGWKKSSHGQWGHVQALGNRCDPGSPPRAMRTVERRGSSAAGQSLRANGAPLGLTHAQAEPLGRAQRPGMERGSPQGTPSLPAHLASTFLRPPAPPSCGSEGCSQECRLGCPPDLGSEDGTATPAVSSTTNSLLDRRAEESEVYASSTTQHSHWLLSSYCWRRHCPHKQDSTLQLNCFQLWRDLPGSQSLLSGVRTAW